MLTLECRLFKKLKSKSFPKLTKDDTVGSMKDNRRFRQKSFQPNWGMQRKSLHQLLANQTIIFTKLLYKSMIRKTETYTNIIFN